MTASHHILCIGYQKRCPDRVNFWTRPDRPEGPGSQTDQTDQSTTPPPLVCLPSGTPDQTRSEGPGEGDPRARALQGYRCRWRRSLSPRTRGVIAWTSSSILETCQGMGRFTANGLAEGLNRTQWAFRSSCFCRHESVVLCAYTPKSRSLTYTKGT